ncbi:MAG TPA: hypothetical protein VGQ99_16755 [Tepidisphaeraceae bacterium]|jgi:hypothetical protein|nr:hypothetical protein [Tepidisphaeraceae bacterium]
MAIVGQIPPRWRPLLMQGALCVVLAASLGLAAWVSRRQARTLRVVLGKEAVIIDGLTVFRPEDWTLRRDDDGLLLEEMRKGVASPRKLRIRYARSSIFMSPMEYLVRCGELHVHEASALMEAATGPRAEVVKTINIGGWPGILLSQTRMMSGVDARQQMMWKRTLACAVMPGGDVVLLRLEGEGAASSIDEDLVRRVADALEVNERERPEMGGEIELAGGIRVNVPTGTLRGSERDPLRIGRRLTMSNSQEWVGVDLTPCVAFPRENDQSLPAMLLLRDPQYHPGPIQKIDEQTWMCARDERGLFGGMAVLKCGSDGRALLAEFRWDRFSQSARTIQNRVSALRQSIMQGVRFEDEGDLTALLNRGAAARRGLPADAHVLFDWENPNETWQWYDEISAHTSQLRIAYRDERAWISAGGSTTAGLPMFSFETEFFSWRLARDWSAYEFALTRAGQSASLSHSVRMSKGKLETEIVEAGDGVIRGTTDVSAIYVPGGLLPLVLGRLPFEPMLLSTESMPATAGASPGLILLRLDPAFDMPRTLPGSAEAMRCWNIQLNGCGETSRWYLDEKGRVQAVAFAGKVVLQRKEQSN